MEREAGRERGERTHAFTQYLVWMTRVCCFIRDMSPSVPVVQTVTWTTSALQERSSSLRGFHQDPNATKPSGHEQSEVWNSGNQKNFGFLVTLWSLFTSEGSLQSPSRAKDVRAERVTLLGLWCRPGLTLQGKLRRRCFCFGTLHTAVWEMSELETSPPMALKSPL